MYERITRQCQVCKHVLPIEKFKKKKQYFSNTCRSCEHQKSKSNASYMISRMLTQAELRCKNPKRHGYSNYGGRGIKFLMTKEDKKEFKNKFLIDTQALIDAGKTPSIDRMDANGHYELSNIRVIEYEVNSEEARKRVSETWGKRRASITHKICRECKETKPIKEMSIKRQYEDGTTAYDTQCKECYRKMCRINGWGERSIHDPDEIETKVTNITVLGRYRNIETGEEHTIKKGLESGREVIFYFRIFKDGMSKYGISKCQRYHFIPEDIFKAYSKIEQQDNLPGDVPLP